MANKMLEVIMLSCPYDPVHQIESERMSAHLVKCRKNQKDLAYEACPFNSTHNYPQAEMRYHMDKCPDKYKLVREMHKPEPTVPYKYVGADIANLDYNGSEENWDAVDCKSYDANAHADNVIRNHISSAADKRHFREQQRLKLNQMGYSTFVKPEEKVVPAAPPTETRRPHNPPAIDTTLQMVAPNRNESDIQAMYEKIKNIKLVNAPAPPSAWQTAKKENMARNQKPPQRRHTGAKPKSVADSIAASSRNAKF